jgi:hypothetical protein
MTIANGTIGKASLGTDSFHRAMDRYSLLNVVVFSFRLVVSRKFQRQVQPK